MLFIGANQPVGSTQEQWFYAVIGSALLMLAIGLFNLWNWARIAMIGLAGLALILYVLLILSLIIDTIRIQSTFYGIMIPLFALSEPRGTLRP